MVIAILPIMKALSTVSLSLSDLIIVLLISGSGAMYEIAIANTPQRINTIPTRSIKGKSGQYSRKIIEKTKEPIPATNALLAVAFFQNNPNRKITTIPGVKNPVNS